MKLIPYFLRTTYWMKDYLKGSLVRHHYNDIRVIMENPVIGSERRRRHLDDLLRHTTQHAPFYKQYESKDLQNYPVVNKTILLRHYDQIKISSDKIPNHKGAFSIQTTSGSTGTPFAVPQDSEKKYRRIAELKYFGERAGFKSHDKLVQLRTWNRWQNKPRWQSMRENIIPYNITKIDSNKLKELCELIIKNKVVAIRGYASSIDLLVRHVKENNIKLPSLELIVAVSESLQDATRELVHKHIGCNIISQYANQENGVLAQEEIIKDSDPPFNLNQASYFFEILKLDEDKPAEYGELGRIIITDLFNYAFPMIRYDTGDTAIMIKESSNGYPVISKLYGRRLDLVFDTTGDIVYPIAIARILKHYKGIVQWQFIQNNKNEYLVKFVKNSEEINEQEIKNELQDLFGKDANIMFTFVNEIPVLASGKRKSVINNWENR